MRTICYFSSSFFENIGNAFIDIGSILSISKCIKDNNYDYRLIQTSMSPCMLYSFSTQLKIPFKLFWRICGEKLSLTFLETKTHYLKHCNIFNLAEHIRPDIFIISGCTFTVFFFKIYGNILNKLKEKNVKLIFYGCGGNTYSDFEIEFVSKWLDTLQPYAIITRDKIAFKKYRGFAERCFNGIDCGFFVGYLPLKGVHFDFAPYVVLTFDKFKNKVIEEKLIKDLSNYTVIRATHVPHPDKTIFPFPKKDYQVTLISENPYDYLLLYANAERVYSDRIHACVASLAFGVPCKLYNDSPRITIFSKVARISNENLFLPVKRLHKYQLKQLNYLSQLFSEIE